jgi:hypothetical protein
MFKHKPPTHLKKITQWWHRAWNGYSIEKPLDHYSHIMVYKYGYERPAENRPPERWARVLKAIWAFFIKLHWAIGILAIHLGPLGGINSALDFIDKIIQLW